MTLEDPTTTYTVDIRFAVRPLADADAALHDQHGISDFMGQALQDLTVSCRREGLDVLALPMAHVCVIPVALADARDSAKRVS